MCLITDRPPPPPLLNEADQYTTIGSVGRTANSDNRIMDKSNLCQGINIVRTGLHEIWSRNWTKFDKLIRVWPVDLVQQNGPLPPTKWTKISFIMFVSA